MKIPENLAQENAYKIRAMRWVLVIGCLLMLTKFAAWSITHSNAILTDALESIINIAAAAFGLFSIYYAARPKDENHPYGHGKMEFLAVGFEGGLIFFTGGAMIGKAIYNFYNPVSLHQVNTGFAMIAITSVVNFIMGRLLLKKGIQYHSKTLEADGKHLLSDTWSSLILLAGLGLILLTGKEWIDSVLTLGLGIYIIIVGYRLIRDSLAGLMDEADFVVLKEVIQVFNTERRDHWIDIHNLRVVKYGSALHVDSHLTLPWYEDLKTSHDQEKHLETLVNSHFGNRVEFFIHTDPCLPVSCSICALKECKVRQQPFVRRLEWDAVNLLRNQPHSYS